ncbi:hypothetical protein AMAG_08067 [Allomyces macrogynus ATCC 38327]|uniref:Uncharacterized protein n=1 Tax=Allomyces macrogynus (strain ATCC 38327) TaxID=578462 RepID=A0A0L0SKG0_ALLM3|nr:hypothetical protein AMAG_08067 [Allomyces macrogynus ATCC 38327]|eukprot:KNE62890.1 hypothetical protein AMAG_08067 [Allomyces macrogynus ATCC 38327]
MDRIVELWATIDKDPTRKAAVREHKLRCTYIDRSSSTTSVSMNPAPSIAMPTPGSAAQSVMSLAASSTVPAATTTMASRPPHLDVLGVVATATALPPSPLVAAISLPASPIDAAPTSASSTSPMTALAESAAGKPPGPRPRPRSVSARPVISAPNVTAASSATAVYDVSQVTALEAEVARLQGELNSKTAAVAKLQAQMRAMHEQLAAAQADADRAREEKYPRRGIEQPQHQVVVVAADTAWSMQVLVAVAVAAFVGGAVLF